MREDESFWRKCSSCKVPIEFKAKHYVCSVSTCNALRTGYVFCSVSCFDKHLPGARHRDAGAIEKTAGTQPYSADEPNQLNNSPQRKLAVPHSGGAITQSKLQVPKDVLVVVSKLKDYIKARSDMNTSQDVIEILSDQIRLLCDDAIDKARMAGRKTVLDRDFEK